MGKKSEKKFVLTCKIGDIEVKVPLYCKKQMQVKENDLTHTLCNSEEEMPVCCENIMMLVDV